MMEPELVLIESPNCGWPPALATAPPDARSRHRRHTQTGGKREKACNPILSDADDNLIIVDLKRTDKESMGDQNAGGCPHRSGECFRRDTTRHPRHRGTAERERSTEPELH